ncbi:RidA family protein [Nocardia sp. NPDC004123]
MTIEHAPGQIPAFSGAVKAGALITTSGVVSHSVLDGRGADITFEQEAAEVIENLKEALESVGAELSQVMRIDAFLSDAGLAARWNDVFVRTWADPRPARCTTVTGFTIPGVRLEISAIASTA